jgi:hypothetical protein
MPERFTEVLFNNHDLMLSIVFILAFAKMLFMLLRWIVTTTKSVLRRRRPPDFINFFYTLPQETQNRFISSLDTEDLFAMRQGAYQRQAQQAMFDRYNRWAMHENNLFQQQQAQQAIHEQFNQWAMHEATKSVTPVDCGGYVQGYGFNPSDTMLRDMDTHQHHQMDSHHHNDHHSQSW